MSANIREGYTNAIHELLLNIKRSAIRGRNAAQTESNMIATSDHIENLADEALSYFDGVPIMGRCCECGERIPNEAYGSIADDYQADDYWFCSIRCHGKFIGMFEGFQGI